MRIGLKKRNYAQQLR